MVTRSGWLLLVVSAVMLAAGRAFGLAEFFVLGATGICLVIWAVMDVWRRAANLDVERIVHPRRVHLAGYSRVELRVTNQSSRRSPLLTLLDPVAGTVGARVALAPLTSGATTSASYRLPTDRRGIVQVGPLEAQRTDAFGLARRRVVVAETATLTVLPAIEAIPTFFGGGAADDPLSGAGHPVVGAAGDEDFATLRPYTVGDDLRRVHWASSARAGDLLVRQDDPPWKGHITVLLDARADHLNADTFEVAVCAAASLIHAIANKGDRCRLVITDGTDTGLVDARAAQDTLLEHLAIVARHTPNQLQASNTGARGRTGGLVVMTSAPTLADLAQIKAAHRLFAAVHLVVFDPSCAGGTPQHPPAGLEAGVDVSFIDAATSFSLAWGRRSSRTGSQS